MWSKIREMVTRKDQQPVDVLSTPQAVTALMVYTARLDEHYGEDEREHILELLAHHHWDQDTPAEELVSKAEALCEEALDCYGFLRVLNNEFDEENRHNLLRMIWSVVLVDGLLDEYEANMMRRITSLLGISDFDSGMIRREIMEQA